jgi:hypothetical protein
MFQVIHASHSYQKTRRADDVSQEVAPIGERS